MCRGHCRDHQLGRVAGGRIGRIVGLDAQDTIGVDEAQRQQHGEIAIAQTGGVEKHPHVPVVGHPCARRRDGTAPELPRLPRWRQRAAADNRGFIRDQPQPLGADLCIARPAAPSGNCTHQIVPAPRRDDRDTCALPRSRAEKAASTGTLRRPSLLYAPGVDCTWDCSELRRAPMRLTLHVGSRGRRRHRFLEQLVDQVDIRQRRISVHAAELDGSENPDAARTARPWPTGLPSSMGDPS